MNFGKRLAYAFQLCGTSAPRVARATGVPVASINALIRRDSDRSVYTTKLISALNKNRVNINWVLSGQGNPTPDAPSTEPVNGLEVQMKTTEASVSKMLELPRLGVAQIEGTNGREYFAAAIDSQVLEVPRSWLPEGHTGKGLCWSICKDGDMEPTIPSGSRYVIDQSDKGGADGHRGLYSIVLIESGQEQVRTLTWNPDSTATVEASRDTVRKRVMPTHDFMIVGRVLTFIGSVA